MDIAGTYAGLVEKNDDPLKLGRVKVRVPHVYGATGSGAGSIGVNDLPWAMPAGMPAGGSGKSGGFSMLPEVGDKVWVRFLDGEPEKPIYEWGMQSQPDQANLHLHSYADANGRVGKPNASRWTRYSHALELNDSGIISTTRLGYRLLLTDGSDINDGSVMLSTVFGFLSITDDGESASGNLTLTNDFDLIVVDEIRSSARSYDILATTGGYTVNVGGDVDITGLSAINIASTLNTTIESLADIDVTAQADMSLEALGVLTADFERFTMNSGDQPFVRGTALVTLLESLLVYITSHVHVSATPGTPTSPPVVPPVGINPAVVLSETIFGE